MSRKKDHTDTLIRCVLCVPILLLSWNQLQMDRGTSHHHWSSTFQDPVDGH